MFKKGSCSLSAFPLEAPVWRIGNENIRRVLNGTYFVARMLNLERSLASSIGLALL